MSNFQQILYTTNGTIFEPTYACIFMDYIETEFLKTQAIKSQIWKRFIDDIFFIWTDSETNLNKFLEDLNELHPNLKFTYEKSRKKLTDNKIATDLYCKLKESHQFLNFDLCPAKHIKISIVFSQTLRLKGIGPQKSDLDSYLKALKNWFSKRSYTEKVISEQVNGALRSKEKDVKEKGGQHMKENGIPLVVTF